MSIRFLSGAISVQPENEEQFTRERNSYNKQQLRLTAYFILPFSLILFVRTFLFSRATQTDPVTGLLLAAYAGVALTCLLIIITQRVLSGKLSLKQSRGLQFFFILLFTFFMLGLSLLNIVIYQEFYTYLIVALFLSAAVWLNFRTYITLSLVSFILIVFFLYATGSSLFQMNTRFIQLIIYFLVGLFIYLSMTSLLMENFYNRLSLEEQYLQLATENITDPLTGLYNKRSLNDDLKKEWARSKRTNHPFCLIMIDIDNFRSVNNTFGHIAGDQLIRELSVMIRNEVRLSDKVYRYGGEEFLILVPESSLEITSAVAERIRDGIEKNHFTGIRKTITVSMGLAQSEEDINIDILLNRASQKLLKAKEKGRNRVEL